MKETLYALLILVLLKTPSAQGQFEYTTTNSTITITGYSGTNETLIIPATINGLPVNSIGYEAFLSCYKLTNVTIPSSITNIADDAFSGCRGMRSVSIPNSITSIGNYVFDSTGLVSVTIPASVTNIGNNAFDYSRSLTNVTIPASVVSLGDSVFWNCTGLLSATIPGSIATLNDTFDSCTNLLSVTIGSGVFSIGTSSFLGCANLTNVTVPDSVTNIGDSAFGGCSSLPTINVVDVTSIGDYAFSSCRSLKNINFSSSLTNIGAAAFTYCSSLGSVDIPGSVINLGPEAFAYCRGVNTGLTNATIMDGVTSIGASAFAADPLISVSIPNSVTNIGADAFQSVYLGIIAIPASVAYIGADAFSLDFLSRIYFQGNAPVIDSDVFSGFSSSITVYYLANTAGWGPTFDGMPTMMVSAFPPPYIYQEPVSLLEPRGGLAAFNVGASGAGSLSYQWAFRGTNIAGATNSALLLHGVTADAAGGYQVVMNDEFGSVTSAVAELSIETTNTSRPSISVTISSPLPNARNVASVFGRVTDAKQPIWKVFYSIFTPAESELASGQANVTAQPPYEWSVTNLVPGSNTIYVQAVDFASNSSLRVSRKYFCNAPTPINLLTQGSGGGGFSVKSFVAGERPTTNTLNFGEEYEITAKPDAHSLFGGWIYPTNISFATRGQDISFVMASNLTITADFETNIYLHASGAYNGLFMVSNDFHNVTEDSAGLLSGLLVRTNGTYSGKLWINGVGHPITGAFDAFGQATNFVPHSEGPISLEMTLQANLSPPQIVGTVMGTGLWPWTAELVASRAANNLRPAAYTMLIPPGTNDSPMNLPGGDGYALITNSLSTDTSPGTVKINGALADGTSFSQTTTISEDGFISIYDSLYGNKGLLIGWINLQAPATNGDGLAWIRPQSSSDRYRNGFTSLVEPSAIELSPWTNHSTSFGILTNLVLLDPLSHPEALLQIPVTLNDSFKLEGTSGEIHVRGSINARTGFLTIIFGHGAAETNGFGAVLQNREMGGGYFLTRSNANAFQLSP